MAKRSSRKRKNGNSVGNAVVFFFILSVFIAIGQVVVDKAKEWGRYIVAHPALLWSFIVAIAFILSLLIIKQARQKKYIQINMLLEKRMSCINDMKSAKSVSSFVRIWADFDETESILSSFLGKNKKADKIITTSKDVLSISQSEFQMWLRNVIDRQKKATIELIINDYSGNKDNRQQAYQNFCVDIQSASSRFSNETNEFARMATNEVYSAISVPIAGIKSTDHMNGREFEFWCANLLRKNGFNKVVVTPGSGDQGVDILAVKNGIRYAVQCKCYSSDLGNKPIQEVHAGKDIYNCHVGVVMTNRHFTSGAVEAAKKTNTLLWDRSVLQKMIEASYENS